MFEFVSHESFPEDKYVTEAVTFCLEGKYRVIYVRKVTGNGGRFWDEISCAVTRNGEKKYIRAWQSDSSFLRDGIIAYLEKRSWEKEEVAYAESDDAPF